MNRFSKLTQAALALVTVMALSSCSLGQAAEPTPTPVDVNAVMTSAAATAFVQLTQIAAQASPTSLPSATPTMEPSATPTSGTPDPLLAEATQGAGALPPTATDAAGGLPVAPTLAGGGLPASTPVPSLTPFIPVGSSNDQQVCYNAVYVADVTIPDGTVLKPGEKFRKVWRIQNTGSCAWDEGFGLAPWNGPAMDAVAVFFSANDQKVGAGGTVDIGVDMVAPSQPGDYIAHWSMVTDSGKTFGGDFTVFIKVSN